MAELNRGRVAAVLTADTELDVGAGLAAEVSCEGNELADAILVELSEGIVLIDLLVVVSAEELACVVTGEAEGHLGEVVGTKGEELSFLLDLRVSGSNDNILNLLELLDLANQRDLDLGIDGRVSVLWLNVQSGADNCLGLHNSDFRVTKNDCTEN